MASTATPFGAEPVGTLSASGSFSGKVRHYPIATTYGTQISYGDFVLCVDDGSVARAAVTTTVPTGLVGIFMGCTYTDPVTGQFTCSQYWPASNAATDAQALVADDPFLVFKMQADGTLADTTVFNNCSCNNVTTGVGLGRSKNSLDASAAAVTNTLPIRILELEDDPRGNEYRVAVCTYNPGKHAHLAPLGV
jgi:hypothetical protein